ncbi:MAG: hypothetical protein CSA62_09865 [Planctomycetota bacterium]|nr:MAG: hypothetical protein CSA62_09865 [Planctomycetota bacterium]
MSESSNTSHSPQQPPGSPKSASKLVLPKGLQALFLDAGNTILSLDFEFLSQILLQAGLAESGAKLDASSLARAEAAARVNVTEYLEGGHSTEADGTLPIYLQAMLVHAGATAAALSLDALHPLAQQLKEPKTWDALWSQLDPELPGLFRQLRERGLRLIVVSNADGTVARKLANVGLEDAFDAVIDSQLVGVEKPDPAIFHLALEIAACPAEKALHVGDLPTIDYVGARAAGCHACILDPFGDWGPSKYPSAPNLKSICQALLTSD